MRSFRSQDVINAGLAMVLTSAAGMNACGAIQYTSAFRQVEAFGEPPVSGDPNVGGGSFITTGFGDLARQFSVSSATGTPLSFAAQGSELRPDSISATVVATSFAAATRNNRAISYFEVNFALDQASPLLVTFGRFAFLSGATSITSTLFFSLESTRQPPTFAGIGNSGDIGWSLGDGSLLDQPFTTSFSAFVGAGPYRLKLLSQVGGSSLDPSGTSTASVRVVVPSPTTGAIMCLWCIVNARRGRRKDPA